MWPLSNLNRTRSNINKHKVKRHRNFDTKTGALRGFGELGYLFSGSLGALLIILGELGSKHILLGIKGALPKSKKKYQASILFNSLKFCWLLGAIAPRPPYINVISFQFLYLSFRDIQYVYSIPFDNLERGLDYFCPTKNVFLEMLPFYLQSHSKKKVIEKQ